MRPYYMLDTNMISEIFKPFPNENAYKKLQETSNLCVLSSTVWNELMFGAEIMPEGKKKDYVLSKLLNEVQNGYDILPYDKAAATIQADIRSRLKKSGQTVEFADTQIAAIAISNNMILVTRNTKHFKQIQEVSPLLMENWFENPASL